MRDRAAVRLPIRSPDLDDGCVYQIDRQSRTILALLEIAR
jgi:hypothetical protein